MTAVATPTSIQASLSRWFAFQTLIGLSAVCAVIYALTAWSFQLKQESEFERHVELGQKILPSCLLWRQFPLRQEVAGRHIVCLHHKP